jgi:hypothetical protein
MEGNIPLVTAALEFIELNPRAFALPRSRAFFGFDDLAEAQQVTRLGYVSEGEELTFKLAYQMRKVCDTSGYRQIVQNFGDQLVKGAITTQDWDKIATRAIDTSVAQASGTAVIFVDVSEGPYLYPKILTETVLPGLRSNAKVDKILYLTGVNTWSRADHADPRHPHMVLLEAQEPEVLSNTNPTQPKPGEPWQYIKWSTQQASVEQFQSTIDQLRQKFIPQATKLSPSEAKAPFQRVYSIIESIYQQQRTGRLVPPLTGPLNFAAWTLALDLIDTFSERTTRPNANPTVEAYDVVKPLLGRLGSIPMLPMDPTEAWTQFATIPNDQITELEIRSFEIIEFFEQGKTPENRRLGDARSAPTAPVRTPFASLNEKKEPSLAKSLRHVKTKIEDFRHPYRNDRKKRLLARLRRGCELHQETVSRLEAPLDKWPGEEIKSKKLVELVEQLRLENKTFHRATFPALRKLLIVAIKETDHPLELEKLEKLQRFIAAPRDIVAFAKIIRNVASTEYRSVVPQLVLEAGELPDPDYTVRLTDRFNRHTEHLTHIQEGRSRPELHDAFKRDTLPLVILDIKLAQKTFPTEAKDLNRLLKFLAGTNDAVRYAQIITALTAKTDVPAELVEQAHRFKERQKPLQRRPSSPGRDQNAGMENQQGQRRRKTTN